MLGQCLRRWVHIVPTLGECFLGQSQRLAHSQQTQNICITFVQRQPNVCDIDPTLYKCHTNVLCLLGCNNGQSYLAECLISCVAAS